MTAKWYVLCSKPHKERTLRQYLEAKGFDVFLPCQSLMTDNTQGMKATVFFPGYLFVKVDLERIGLSTFQRMPFTEGIVLFGDKPGNVPDELVHAIQTRLENSGNVINEPVFKPPTAGAGPAPEPITGFESIFDTRLSGIERVVGLLKMLRGASFNTGIENISE